MRYFIFITKSYLLVIILINFIISCKNNSSNPANNNLQYSDIGNKALVIIVENKDIIGFSDVNLYNNYKSAFLPIFSKLFSVPENDLKDLTLPEIINSYGEPWQINRINDAANGHYDKIIKLNNETATSKCLIDSLLVLKKSGYTIDLILNMHASPGSLLFNDGEVNINDLVQEILQDSIKIRSVYQTCCFGKSMINNWKSIGVYVVNGAEDENSVTLFSAAFFVKEWVSGKSFENAVYSAYYEEIDTLKSFSNIVPIDLYFTQSRLQKSTQNVDGLNIELMWKEIPIFIFM
jgi:hypothetical protein